VVPYVAKRNIVDIVAKTAFLGLLPPIHLEFVPPPWPPLAVYEGISYRPHFVEIGSQRINKFADCFRVKAMHGFRVPFAQKPLETHPQMFPRNTIRPL
jgi:hypothetical protein